MSNSEEFELGNIRTQWSLVQRAHLDDQSGLQAMHTLVMRYAPAIARFVRIVVRDESLAEELAQEDGSTFERRFCWRGSAARSISGFVENGYSEHGKKLLGKRKSPKVR